MIAEKVPAAQDLCAWCIAIEEYYDAKKRLEPMQQQIDSLKPQMKVAAQNFRASKKAFIEGL